MIESRLVLYNFVMEWKGVRMAKICIVNWNDTSTDVGWKSDQELKSPMCTCQTVGFYISEDKKVIRLALSRTMQRGFVPFGDVITIPKSAITNRKNVKNPLK